MTVKQMLGFVDYIHKNPLKAVRVPCVEEFIKAWVEANSDTPMRERAIQVGAPDGLFYGDMPQSMGPMIPPAMMGYTV